MLKYERKIHDIKNYYMVNVMDMWSKDINNLLLLSIVYLARQVISIKTNLIDLIIYIYILYFLLT